MFSRSADQQLLEETTKRFLDASCPPATLRDLAGTKSGYEPAFWKQGAGLGWTSLMVPEDAGGGSVSDNGAADLALVAFQFGLHAAPGPLIGSNVVAAALGRWGNEHQRSGPLAELLGGDAGGAWACLTGDLLDGVASPVEVGAEAAHILVTAGHAQFLVPADTPGLTITPLHGLDMTRRFARLEFDGVVAPESWRVEAPDEAADWLLDLAVTIQVAEMCGAMTWAFDTTLDWAFNRYSFGRPLASYQEIKHRFADMKLWLEASYAIAAQAASSGTSDAASAAKSYIGRFGVELLQDCVQIHGGIGVTFDHDLHVFLRRVVTDAALYGSAGDHGVRLANLLERHA